MDRRRGVKEGGVGGEEGRVVSEGEKEGGVKEDGE